MIDLLK